MHQDIILEGANEAECDAVTRLCQDPEYRPDPELADRLEAKGWVD